MGEWLGAIVDHCVVKLLGGIGQCRVARHCQGLGGMARGHEHGCYCQAAWQDLWLHSAIKLLGGRVHIGGWNPDRVSVSLAQQPHGGRCSTSSASSSVQLPQHAVFCGALNYFFALVMLGFVPTAGVSVTVGGFVGAKGVRGYYDGQAVDLQGGNSRPP